MKIQIGQLNTITVVSCDKCSRQQKYMAKCRGCDKDVCDYCRKRWDTDPFTGSSDEYYWQYTCDACTPRLATYREQCTKLRMAYEASIEAVEAAWRTECKTPDNQLES